MTDDIFQYIFLTENEYTLIPNSQTLVLNSPVNKMAALIQVMACHLLGAKPLPEPVLTMPLPTSKLFCVEEFVFSLSYPFWDKVGRAKTIENFFLVMILVERIKSGDSFATDRFGRNLWCLTGYLKYASLWLLLAGGAYELLDACVRRHCSCGWGSWRTSPVPAHPSPDGGWRPVGYAC